MIPEEALTLEDAYELATKRFLASGKPQAVRSVFHEPTPGTLVGVPTVDHFVIEDAPEQ